MIDSKTGTSNIVPDIRPDKIKTYEESYTPPLTEDETEEVTQTATYKFVDMHPILGGILEKLGYFRTHAAATWYNKLAGKTVKDKFDEVDAEIQVVSAKIGNLKIFPDFENIITTIGGVGDTPTEITYTCTEDCFILAVSSNNTTATYLKVNNVTIFSSADSKNNCDHFLFMAKEGDIIKFKCRYGKIIAYKFR